MTDSSAPIGAAAAGPGHTTQAAAAPSTTRITVLPHPQLCPQGLQFEARAGRKLVDEGLGHGIAIEHACEK